MVVGKGLYSNESIRYNNIMRNGILLLILLFFLSACGSSDSSATLQANYNIASTQITDLRLTGTVQAARARTTVDFVQTRAAFSATQSQFYQSTLAFFGTPVAFLEEQRERILGSTPTPSITPTLNAETSATVALAFSNPAEPTATPTPPIVTPFSLIQTLTVAAPLAQTTTQGARLENFVTALGVGEDDCALDVTSTFSTTTPAIYVVVTAVEVPAGSVIEAHWYRSGQPVGPVYNFIPDFDIDRACVWIYVDPTDFEFTPDNYTVDFTLNGQPASPLINFAITNP